MVQIFVFRVIFGGANFRIFNIRTAQQSDVEQLTIVKKFFNFRVIALQYKIDRRKFPPYENYPLYGITLQRV